MSEEEKKAIEDLKDTLNKEKEWGKKTFNDYKSCSDLYGNGDVEILLNLMEKQEKEIEELTTELLLQKDLYKNDYIKKSKIEDRIKELENARIPLKSVTDEECDYARERNIQILIRVDTLKMLLESEDK